MSSVSGLELGTGSCWTSLLKIKIAWGSYCVLRFSNRTGTFREVPISHSFSELDSACSLTLFGAGTAASRLSLLAQHAAHSATQVVSKKVFKKPVFCCCETPLDDTLRKRE